jgi:hypothetical protein
MPDVIMNLTGYRRKIFWEPEPEPIPEVKVVAEIKIQKPKKPANATTPPILHSPKRNGHKSNKERELIEQERAYIKSIFMSLSGCLNASSKMCSFLCNKLNETKESIRLTQKIPGILADLSVFQVTGYVSVLHRHIAKGTLDLESSEKRDRYLSWMQSRYKLWARYNSEKYRHYREKNIMIPGHQPSRRYVHGVF